MSEVPLRNVDLVEPQVAEALMKVRELYPDAFLAGGYLRDRASGVFPTDLDFFTFLPIREERKEFITIADSAGFGLVEKRLTNVETFKDVDFTSADTFGAVFPAQIIHMNPEYAATPWTTISKFLFGAQQVFWAPDISGKTPYYLQDMQCHTFTVTRCDHAFDASSVAFKWLGTGNKTGLKKRYSGWILRIPEKWRGAFEEHFYMEGCEVIDGHIIVDDKAELSTKGKGTEDLLL
jgi:hypothetical protein